MDFRNLQSDEHSIDLNRRLVTKKLNKKYKFEATLPIEVHKKIEFVDNSFLL